MGEAKEVGTVNVMLPGVVRAPVRFVEKFDDVHHALAVTPYGGRPLPVAACNPDSRSR